MAGRRVTGAICVCCLRMVNPKRAYRETVAPPARGFYLFCNNCRPDVVHEVPPPAPARPFSAVARKAKSKWVRR